MRNWITPWLFIRINVSSEGKMGTVCFIYLVLWLWIYTLSLTMRKHWTDAYCRTFCVFNKRAYFSVSVLEEVKSAECMRKQLHMISGDQVLPGAIYTLWQSLSLDSLPPVPLCWPFPCWTFIHLFVPTSQALEYIQ